jgi:signal transduction histidine kinase
MPVAADPPAVAAGRIRRLVSGVRFRVTAIATVVVALVLATTGTLLVLDQRRTLTDAVDDSLERRADDVEAVLAGGPVTELAGGLSDEEFAQVVDADGKVVAASPIVRGDPPIAPPLPAGDDEAFRDVSGLTLDETNPFRVLSRRVDVDGETFVINAAGDLEDVNEGVASLALALAVVFPAVLVVMAVLMWLALGRALRPVEAIRTEVARISADELDRRVPVPPTHDEIGRLARTMNGMLDRIEQTHRQQQQFVADASHELRSPLTNIRSELEVDLAHPASADLAATHRSVLEETIRLQQVADDLLHLARSDAGAAAPQWSVVAVDEVVLAEIRALRARGRVAVDASGVSGAQVRGDAGHLTRAVRNLLENAERHAAATVTVRLQEHGDEAELRVRDDGPGVPPELADRIFERFTRLDAARDRDHGGSGLGLAITRDIVVAHGGTIAVAPDATPGATFVVRLPLASPGDE